MENKLIIGSRGSQLALWQTNWVKAQLIKNHPDLIIDIKIIKTKGDKILDVPLAKIGDAGLFVKEIEDALLNKSIDLAVHSMKDMPAAIPDGLIIGAVPKRETPNDVLISKGNLTFNNLPKNARIGTSSLRRISQLLHHRPDLKTEPIRGNLDTRLKKLESENLDGIILAAAGLKRLGFEEVISDYLDFGLMLPAVGQGALCIETRENDKNTSDYLSFLKHRDTEITVRGERAFLKHLKGGCQIPIAAHGTIDKECYRISGLVAELDGKTIISHTETGSVENPEEAGIILAKKLLADGADTILEKIKKNES